MTVQDSLKRRNFEDPELENKARLSRFLLKERKYDKQFSHIYFQRLNAMKPHLAKLAEKSWSKPFGAEAKVPKYSDKVLDVKGGKLSYLVGTTYANMDAKPSIIDDVKNDLWVVNPPQTEKYFKEEASFSIEDESGRMKIYGDKLKNYNLVSGAVVALLGKESALGEFEVEDIILPGQLSQSPINEAEEPRYFIFVSGLNFGDNEHEGSLELLLEFLLGGVDIGNVKSKNIIKMIVAGNIYGPLDSNENSEDPTPKIDCFLNQVCQSIPVYLLPGANDPTTRALPQQPLHSGLFNTTNGLPTLHLASNPFDAELMGLRIMGTAGQPINDLKKCGSDELNSLDWLEASLKFGHFAPTSPDTLYCYPYSDHDPFVLTACPHVYFAGNQDKFFTKMVSGDQGQKTRLITIPSFSTSGQIVLVEASTLEATLINVNPCIDQE